MKKRIISMLLALAIVFGVIAVPAFDSSAASKKAQVYTKIVLASNKKTNVTFTVTKDNKNKAAAQLNTLFARMLPKSKTLDCTVNGKAAKITSDGKNTYVTVGGTTTALKAYVKATAKTKAKVEVTFNANTKKVLSALSLAKNGQYTYGVKIGGASLKSFKTKKGYFFFKAYGKSEKQGYIKNGVLYVKGDVVKSQFVKALKKSGTVKSAKLVKVAGK